MQPGNAQIKMLAAAALLLIAAAAVFIFTQNQGTEGMQLERVDVSISNISVQGDALRLGEPTTITVSARSTSEAAQYRLVVRENGEQVHSGVYNGTQDIALKIPVIEDGPLNITAALFIYDKKQFIDTDPSNEVASASVTASPIITMRAPHNTSGSNYTSVHSERLYAVPLHLESDARIYSIGMLVRKTAVLSADTLIRFTLHKDEGGVPAQEPLREFSERLVRVRDGWNLLLLPSDRKIVPAGSYWIVASTTEGGYASILCYETEGNTTLTGRASEYKHRWSPHNCMPYMIVSSRGPAAQDDSGEYALPKEFFGPQAV
ncbi:MAG: hypothetical protein QXU54_00435 [Candidatus Micrarchaeia archaeon]